MAWFSRSVSLGNFPDFSEAVNKLSESVKNIEKNFDTALGLEEKSNASGDNGDGSGLWPSTTDGTALFEPIIGYMGQKGRRSTDESSKMPKSPVGLMGHKSGETPVESSLKPDSSEPNPPSMGKIAEDEGLLNQASERTTHQEEAKGELKHTEVEEKVKDVSKVPKDNMTADHTDTMGIMEAGSREKIKDANEEPKDNATADDTEAGMTEAGSREKMKDANEEPKDIASAGVSEGEVIEVGSEVKVKNTSEEAKDNSIADTSIVEVMETESQEKIKDTNEEPKDNFTVDCHEADVVLTSVPIVLSEQKPEEVQQTELTHHFQEERSEETTPDLPGSVSESAKILQDEERLEEVFPAEVESRQMESTSAADKVEYVTSGSTSENASSYQEGAHDKNAEKYDSSAHALDAMPRDSAQSRESSASDNSKRISDAEDESMDKLHVSHNSDAEPFKASSDMVTPWNDASVKQHLGKDAHVNEERSTTGSNSSASVDSVTELEKLKKEMTMMETALYAAARQAQVKADEIAKLMNENEQLNAVINDLKRKTTEADIESLREEYHQRVSTLERKVYSLTKERDTLRREQNKKNDASALLKEKDEIITQVMAEGEQLSKKQAALESQIRKFRAQVRELEEEKKGLLTKLQAEENKVESIRKDKAATEKLLQETVEKHQAELAAQKEYYTNALNAAKEAEALIQARASSEARTELESRLREVEERESMLVQTIEELRQTLSRKEQQTAFREDMLRRDIEDLQKRNQASERRCEELVTQVPESTRPLLRQIEAMQENAARKAESWAAVERSLNSRLQEAEANAATSEEKERSMNERLGQTLSRMNVLEAQISCLRAEQTQATKSLEKERQRAAENRQEYLALQEDAETHGSRAKQLEEEIRELRKRHKEELHELRAHQELLQQELEREKAARFDQDRVSHLQSIAIPDQSPRASPRARPRASTIENGNLSRRISSASSLNSMEESYFLQTTLGSSENFSEHRTAGEGFWSPYNVRNMTSSTLEAALRQKEGELASYSARLASMESIRDSLAEELVKLTAQCEKLRSEATALPGVRAELDALRKRHSAALELMGERDEELEELRNDIVDLKEMYKEQVNLLVNKIQILSNSIAAA